MQNSRSFERYSVEVSDDGIAELDEGRRNVFVPRAEIREVQLSYGLGSERPLATTILGLVLLVVGLWPLGNLILVLARGGVFYVEAIAGVAFVALGVWLIRFALRKRLHLLVRTERQRRKLLFHGNVTQEGLVELLRAAERDFGYLITQSSSLEELSRRGVVRLT